MNGTEGCLAGAAGAGLVLWGWGCWRRSGGSCVLGLLLGVAAVAGYFIVFELTQTAFLGVWMLTPFLVVLVGFFRFARTKAGTVLAGVMIVVIGLSAAVEYKLVSMGNALLVIEPYRAGKIWCFDEPRLRLRHEPFVRGIPEMIDRMVVDIPGSQTSVRLIFSQRPFPGWQHRLDLRRGEDGGNWYACEEFKMEGWLCPALFKFFPRAPQHIYARAEEK